ncbi:MAG: hypothetical protein ABSA32_11790 [Candidatus Acidiferrales bacterium]|jgi:hypothetical protein
MKRFLPVIVLIAMPTICSAQIPNIHKPTFGVQRQKASSPQVSLAGVPGSSASSAISSNSPQTLTFNIQGIDESKGVTVNVGQPCHADKTPQTVSAGVYKVTLTFDTVTQTDTCSIEFQSVANSTSAELKIWVAATQTDPGIAIFQQAKSISIRTDNGKTINAAVSNRQIMGPSMAMLMIDTDQGTIMVTVIAPNMVQVNLNGCMLQGTVNGSTANVKAMAAMPACNGANSGTVSVK